VRVLVVGSGGREHSLCEALARDPEVTWLGCGPGNAGTAAVAETTPLDAADPAAVVGAARDHAADLVVVGPEAPLVAGVADALRAAGIACFGPGAAAARLEGSKAFAKEVMAEAGVPTAAASVATTGAELDRLLAAAGAPYVVKDDGLAAGKGVLVTADRAAAAAHGRGVLATGAPVLVEEFLDGPEVSLFVLSDGDAVVPLLPAQDAKRIGDGDTGPNTGGMGAYAPLPWAPPDLVGDVTERVVRPTVAAMRRRGTPFAGLLYVGLAVGSRGARVVEFNARFGDPETQAVLALLETPLAGLLAAAAAGTLADAAPLAWRPGAAVTVVVAAPGYPAAPRTGGVLGGLEQVAAVPGVAVLHAGTRAEAGRVVAAGGRILAVTATGADLGQARGAVYEAVSHVTLDGLGCGAPGGPHARTDIALAAVEGTIDLPEAHP
jgi:phosphoribosylamine---glycine ligase